MRSTPIAWTHSTFNPWLGCPRVSPACDHCCAAAISRRTGRRDGRGRDLWDQHAERVRTSPDYWRAPLRWKRDALAAGARHRVFCASMADIFDNRAPEAWRADLWGSSGNAAIGLLSWSFEPSVPGDGDDGSHTSSS